MDRYFTFACRYTCPALARERSAGLAWTAKRGAKVADRRKELQASGRKCQRDPIVSMRRSVQPFEHVSPVSGGVFFIQSRQLVRGVITHHIFSHEAAEGLKETLHAQTLGAGANAQPA